MCASIQLQRKLMRAVATGDRAAFSSLYDILCVATYSIFRRHIPVQLDADLAMEAMWLDVWRNAASLSREPGTASEKIIAVAERRAQLGAVSAS